MLQSIGSERAGRDLATEPQRKIPAVKSTNKGKIFKDKHFVDK